MRTIMNIPALVGIGSMPLMPESLLKTCLELFESREVRLVVYESSKAWKIFGRAA